MSTSDLSPLGPLSIENNDDGGEIMSETEKAAPWLVRKLVGSMTGRIVRSSYESLRAAGTTVICLSPWGDWSPLVLPCIRFRDLVVHTVVVATGGAAAVATPLMGPISDAVVSTLGDSVLVHVGMHTGFELSAKAANSAVGDKVADKLSGPVLRSWNSFIGADGTPGWATTGIKNVSITLMYKGIPSDAALGFYRSSVHKDSSLFTTVKDYLAVEKGWFSPYLFASGRRPVIPRSIQPDVVFCHGPFLEGDYRVGETLLQESAFAIELCVKATAPDPPPPPPPPAPAESSPTGVAVNAGSNSKTSLTNMLSRLRTSSPEPKMSTLVSLPPAPRRLVMVVVGLKPYRKLWTNSARPGESVMEYLLLNGCPAVVVPVRVGTPLVGWDALTLKMLWKLDEAKSEGVVSVLCEYLDLCVDWVRVVVGPGEDEGAKRDAVRDAVKVLVGSAVKTKDSKPVKKEIDEDRCGIAMWRIP